MYAHHHRPQKLESFGLRLTVNTIFVTQPRNTRRVLRLHLLVMVLHVDFVDRSLDSWV